MIDNPKLFLSATTQLTTYIYMKLNSVNAKNHVFAVNFQEDVCVLIFDTLNPPI